MQELLEYTVAAVDEDPSYEDSCCHMSTEGEWEIPQEHMNLAADHQDDCTTVNGR
jgi:hypothetical protein